MRVIERLHALTRGWLRVLSPASLLLAGMVLSQSALAATTPSLFKSFAGDINFVTTGNTLRAGDNSSNTSASSLDSGNSGNPVDAGTSTETISGIPAGSTIQAAYLYWAGSGATPDYTVTLNGNTVTAPANRQYTETYNAGGGDVLSFFSGAADVTSIVTGNGTYTFGGMSVTNVDVGTVTYFSNQATTAGWAILVIYSNSTTETNRVINVFEGFQAFRNTSINLAMSNFVVPSTNINGKFAVLTWEGDPNAPSNTGETLGLTPGTTLSDACDTNGNQYNSTINTLLCTGNPATDDVFYGVDFDTYDVSSMLTAGESSVTTNYTSGNDLVLLSAQIISVADVPVSDLSITKSHTGTLAYGSNATWTIAVANNGPATITGTTTVTDTLPTGVSYVSATGSGWTCGAAGQTVTCTSTSGVASGASFGDITLTAFIGASAASPLANTATVSNSGGNFDNVSTNNSSTDSATIVAPDLSTSTKNVVNTGGGDAVVGSTLQYTIDVTESAGVPASGISVTDDIPANLSGFTPSSVTVTGSSTVITNSSTATGGANGDGLLTISNITVPANGTVTIVFTAQVASGTANCTTIDNTATVTNPYGNGGTPGAPTVVVAQSSCTATGNKVLYAYDTKTLTRIPQTAGSTGLTINGNNVNADFILTPVLAKNLTLTAGTITAQLVLRRTGATGGGRTNRTITVSLRTGSGVLLTNTVSQTFNSTTATLYTFTLTLAANTTVTAGNTVVLRVNNNSANTTNWSIRFDQWTSAANYSRVTFATSTVINVDSVTAYSAVYPSTTQPANGVFLPGQTVYVCAVVSDPFGSADTDPAPGGTAPTITLTDPNGTVQVSGASMTKEAAADCAGTASTSTEAFEYSYVTSFSVPTGFWTASVTASEGTEGTVTHTANGTFDLDVPSLLITKTASVASDPVEGSTRPKAIPGATVTYTVSVQNNGRGPVDASTLVISDPVPTNTALSLTGKPPFSFTDGSTSSGLSVTTGSDANIVYSNDGGSTYTYTPTCTRPCTDTAITNFKITLTGTMNGKTGATAPSFTITFNVVIQ
ncbi:MAG TPA: hypothetical protein VLV87_09580 [Gammaproteobacteria bacterium]|nr:hypothetical protein [Gammaproteobacteria bacterium]